MEDQDKAITAEMEKYGIFGDTLVDDRAIKAQNKRLQFFESLLGCGSCVVCQGDNCPSVEANDD